MGLTKIKIYTAECDECFKNETYASEFRNAIPEGWGWKTIVQIYNSEKLFCQDCLKLPKSKWEW